MKVRTIIIIATMSLVMVGFNACAKTREETSDSQSSFVDESIVTTTTIEDDETTNSTPEGTNESTITTSKTAVDVQITTTEKHEETTIATTTKKAETTIQATTTTTVPTTTTTTVATTVVTTTTTSLPEHNGVRIPEDEYQLLLEGAQTYGISNFEIVYSTEYIEGSLIVPSVEWYNSAPECEAYIKELIPDAETAENGYGRRQAWKVVDIYDYEDTMDIIDHGDLIANSMEDDFYGIARIPEGKEKDYKGYLYRHSGDGEIVTMFNNGFAKVLPGWSLVPQ